MSKVNIKATTIQSRMKKNKTYKPEYKELTIILADMLCEYAELQERHKSNGYQIVDGDGKKLASITVMEKLRSDILSYTDRLKLNPKSVDTGGDVKSNFSIVDKTSVIPSLPPGGSK